MLGAYVMQFVLNERYANGFLNRLGSDDQLLSIYSLERAPSEGACSRFKNKLSNHLDAIEVIVADVFRECGDEIEHLREIGLIPADKPPLGHSLVIDSTDVEAWARPGRTSRKTGGDIIQGHLRPVGTRHRQERPLQQGRQGPHFQEE